MRHACSEATEAQAGRTCERGEDHGSGLHEHPCWYELPFLNKLCRRGRTVMLAVALPRGLLI